MKQLFTSLAGLVGDVFWVLIVLTAAMFFAPRFLAAVGGAFVM